MVADSDLIKAATDFESVRSRKSFSQRRTGASQRVMNKMDSEFSGCKLTCCLFVQVVMRPEQTVEEGQQVGLSSSVKPTRKVFCLYPKC